MVLVVLTLGFAVVVAFGELVGLVVAVVVLIAAAGTGAVAPIGGGVPAACAAPVTANRAAVVMAIPRGMRAWWFIVASHRPPVTLCHIASRGATMASCAVRAASVGRWLIGPHPLRGWQLVRIRVVRASRLRTLVPSPRRRW